MCALLFLFSSVILSYDEVEGWLCSGKDSRLRGKRPNNVASEIGVSSGIVTHWNNGGIPIGETLTKIADNLECSIDYLMGRTDNPAVNHCPHKAGTTEREAL